MSRAPTSQETRRQEKLSIHTAGILCRKGGKKKLKPFILWPQREYFFYVKLAAREGSRFLLLCLIDINMKYSGVVLIRLGFPARGRGGALLLDQNIFSKNILLESSPPPPLSCSGFKGTAVCSGVLHPHSTAPSPAWQAGRLASQEDPARKLFFPAAASGSLAASQAVVLAAGLAGVCPV